MSGIMELKDIAGAKERFTATYSKSGYKSDGEETVMLKNVYLADYNELVADHVWIHEVEPFLALGLQRGDEVRFLARVKSTVKGFFGRAPTRSTRGPTVGFTLSEIQDVVRVLYGGDDDR